MMKRLKPMQRSISQSKVAHREAGDQAPRNAWML